jgi:hypothetical protein
MSSDDRIAVLLDRFPGPLVLRRSIAKWLKILAVSIVFVAIGGAMIWSPETVGAENSRNLPRFLISLGLARDGRQATLEVAWVTVAFFGTGCLISIIALLPGAAELTLDGEGFVMRNLFRRFSFRWRDVGDFAAVQISMQKAVAFNQHSPPERALAAMNVMLVGHNSALPDTYGLTAEDLARLMALWRARATENR